MGQRRPVTDAEYARLTPQQRIALGLDDQQEGAPATFGGTVLPNPNHLRPLADTDSGIPPTRLSNGISFQHGNFRGKMPGDISNPSSSQLIAPEMRTVGAEMSGGGDIFDQAAQPAQAPPAADIFDQAAAPRKDFSARVGERIKQNVNTPAHLLAALPDAMNEALNHPRQPGQETAGSKLVYPFGETSAAAKAAGVASVGPRTVYGIGRDLFHQYVSDPANLVGDIITAGMTHGIGDDGGAAKEKPAQATPKTPTTPADASLATDRITHAVGVVSPKLASAIDAIRSGKYGKLVPERINHALALAKTFTSGEEPPAPPSPEVPNIYGTPRQLWGQSVPEPSPAAPPRAARIPARTVRQSQALGPNAGVQAQAEALHTAAPGDIFDRAASTPQYAYRVRDVGETGVSVTGSHAQAGTSLPEIQNYLEGREAFSGKPQEVVQIDLSKLDPAHYEFKAGPHGNDWVNFKAPVPEGLITKVEPSAGATQAAPNSPTPPIYPVENISEWGVADQNKQMMRAISPARQGLNADFSSFGRYQPVKSVVAHTFGDLVDDNAVEDALRNDLAKMAAKGEFEEQRAMNEGSGMDIPKGMRTIPTPPTQPPAFTSPWSGTFSRTPTEEPSGDLVPVMATQEAPTNATSTTRSRRRAPISQTVSEPVQPSAQPAEGAQTSIRVPGEDRRYSAAYQIRELADVQPSHNGITFNANPQYKLVNDRNYSNAVNQGKIIEASTPGRFDPAYQITDNPDATNGPIVIDSEGHALGGNGRAMILQRTYRFNPAGAEAYKTMLAQKAQQFGVDPARVQSMKQPVLVRQIDDLEFAKPEGKQSAITDFNKKGTAELTPAERAIADSSRISQATLDDIASRLEDQGANASLADILRGKSGQQVLERLIQDGVLTPQERAAFSGESGLTDAGKERISSLMIGRFFRDAAQIDNAPISLRNKLEKMSAPLAKLDGVENWDLIPHVQQAIDMLEEARTHGTTIDDLLAQRGLFGGESKYTPQAVTLAKALQGESGNTILKAVRQYSQDATDAHRPMFAEQAISPAQAFSEAFAPGTR